MRDLTPKHLRCSLGGCPSVHRLDDGRLMIVGVNAEADPTITSQTFLDLGLRGKIGPDEEAIVISADLLSDLVQTPVGMHSGHQESEDAESWPPSPHFHGDLLKRRAFECRSSELSNELMMAGGWVNHLNDEVARLRDIIRRRLACDGSGIWNAKPHYDLTAEMRDAVLAVPQKSVPMTAPESQHPFEPSEVLRLLGVDD